MSGGFLGVDHVPFNVRLRDARLRLGFSRRALGGLAGITPTTVGRYEALKAWPPVQFRQRLADVLEDDPEWLFPSEIGVMLRGRSARTTTSVFPIEALSLDAPEVRLLTAPDPYEEASDHDLEDRVHAVMDTLTGRERAVLRRHFGFDGEAATLREIGEEFSVTPERVRQIEARALRKLRHPARSRLLKEWVSA